MLVAGTLDEVLSSPAWAALATLLAAAAIAVSIALYRKQRARKALSYEIKITELVSVHSEALDEIKIFFGGEEVANACLLQLRVENIGNVPVAEVDFERPFSLHLKGEGAPLTVDVPTTVPLGLDPTVEIGDQAVQIQPLLLNPHDCLTLKVIARNFTGYDLRYRIVGVSELVDAHEQAKRAERRRSLLVGVGSAIIGALIPFVLASILD